LPEAKEQIPLNSDRYSIKLYQGDLYNKLHGTRNGVIEIPFARHDFDALLNQPIEALLKRRVHVRNSGRKACGIEGITVDRHFPLFGKAVLFALSNVLFHSLEC